MGTLFWVVLFWLEQKEGGNAGSQKSRRAPEWEQSGFCHLHFNRLPRQPSSVLGGAHPLGPSNLRTQLSYSRSSDLPARGSPPAPRSWLLNEWLLDLPTCSQPVLPDSETNLLALQWCLLILASLFPAPYIRVLPTKADYDREM